MAGRSKKNAKARPLDYLYDSAFVVSSAKDYARATFKAAMKSARVSVRPIYNTMFCDCKRYGRCQLVYTNATAPNYCQPPPRNDPSPDLKGMHRFKFFSIPNNTYQQFYMEPPTPPKPVVPEPPPGLKTVSIQTVFRESSAQTQPWQPPAKISEQCHTTPEVLYLENMQWGPGEPFRKGDLPADYHTTEIINKLRHARAWNLYCDNKQDCSSVLRALEAYDWLFRETEIDEMETIRVELMTQLINDRALSRKLRVDNKIYTKWKEAEKKVTKKLETIRFTREREIRKLKARYATDMSAAMRYRIARGGGDAILKCKPDAMHATVQREGFKGAWRDQKIDYYPSNIVEQDHREAGKPARWAERAWDLTQTVHGKTKERDKTKLCERFTKFTESYLAQLHESLKATREGYGLESRRALLIPRTPPKPPHPDTPAATPRCTHERYAAQARLQAVIRGKAVQQIIEIGRRRANDLMEELKTTHALLPEEKLELKQRMRLAKEEAEDVHKNRERDKRIRSLAEEVQGGTISSALIFLSSELDRLHDERKQHAVSMLAAREKQLREAAEAGRRQVEERRRLEHDQIFREVVGVTAESIETYLREVCDAGVERAAEEEAEDRAMIKADLIDSIYGTNQGLSEPERRSQIAELVHNFLLPHVHKEAARRMLRTQENLRLNVVRDMVFGQLEQAVDRDENCIRCGKQLPPDCEGMICCLDPPPKKYRTDPRWRKIDLKPKLGERSWEERYPADHQFKCWLNELIDELAETSAIRSGRAVELKHEYKRAILERVETAIDAKETVCKAIDEAVFPDKGPKPKPYHYTMHFRVDKASKGRPRTPEKPKPPPLPSQVRKIEDEKQFKDKECLCHLTKDVVPPIYAPGRHLLPSELREVTELRKCKCDWLCDCGTPGCLCNARRCICLDKACQCNQQTCPCGNAKCRCWEEPCSCDDLACKCDLPVVVEEDEVIIDDG